MQKLMIKVQDKAREIRNLQDKVLPQLKQQLAETKGIFKGKERKALGEQKSTELKRRLPAGWINCPIHLKEDGYPDVQAFMSDLPQKRKAVVEQYNRDLAEWEQQVSRKPTDPPLKNSTDAARTSRAC